jgi:hypothetical protein
MEFSLGSKAGVTWTMNRMMGFLGSTATGLTCSSTPPWGVALLVLVGAAEVTALTTDDRTVDDMVPRGEPPPRLKLQRCSGRGSGGVQEPISGVEVKASGPTPDIYCIREGRKRGLPCVQACSN